MADGISFDDVADAVVAVKQLQELVDGLIEAVTRLTARVEALEALNADA